MDAVYTLPGGTPVWSRDATLNDSDKSFTVPPGKVWEPVYIAATLQCTATVGNRGLVVRIYDSGGNLVGTTSSVASTAASQNAAIDVGFGNGISGTGAKANVLQISINNGLQTVLPKIYMTAGMYFRVCDPNAVDAAADDLTVELHYLESSR